MQRIDFQNGSHGNHHGFPTRTILAYFDLPVTPILPTKFESIGLSVQEKKQYTDFQDGHHGGNLGFLIGNFFTYFESTNHPKAS